MERKTAISKPPYIDTFESKGFENYRLAISHYQNLLNAFNHQLNTKMSEIDNTISSIDQETQGGIEKMLDNELSNFQATWSTLYDNAKGDAAQTRAILSNLNDIIEKKNDGTGDLIDLSAFLKKIKEGLNIENLDVNIEDFKGVQLDLSALDPKVRKSIYSGNVTNIIAIFGEFFEQAITQLGSNALSGLIDILTTGSIKSATNYQRVAKVKPDALIYLSGMQVDTKDLSKNRVKSFSVNGQAYNYELQDLMNLSNYKDESELMQAITRPLMASGVIGASYKMYSGDIISNFGKISSIQTSGNFTNEYKEYFPNEEGAKPETQRLYNYWAHSRYLLAIIGAYNALYATGSKFGSTAAMLQKLVSQRKGIMGKRDSLLTSAKAQATIKNIDY